MYDAEITPTVLTADSLVHKGRTLFYGVVLLASALGGDVTIYDGNDSDTGRKIGTFKGAANVSTPIGFEKPIPIQRGLFVDVGNNITEVLVIWCPGDEPVYQQIAEENQPE